LLDHPPSFLVIGVDRGVTFLTLANFLARTRETFVAFGIDVLVQEQVAIMLLNMDIDPSKQVVGIMQANSLNVLPRLVESKAKFDLILLDGDHNYHTVRKELDSVDALLNHGGMLIIDDYDGRWSVDDMWYADRAGYEKVELATKKIDTDKHGVKAAVDDWLSENVGWTMSKPLPGEPVLLKRST
jgi:predicted O-methyltransferase YrrM